MSRNSRADLVVNRGIPLRKLLIEHVVLFNVVQSALAVSIVLRSIADFLRCFRHQQFRGNPIIIVSQQHSSHDDHPAVLQAQSEQQIFAGSELQSPRLSVASLACCGTQIWHQRRLEGRRKCSHDARVDGVRV